MAENNHTCEICTGSGLGLLQEGSGMYHSNKSGTAYGDIYTDYADYFYAHGEIATLNGKSRNRLILRPGTPVVSEAKGYVPPYLRKRQQEALPFYKKYVSGTDDIYAYKGRKYGIAKAFEASRIPEGRITTPSVTGYEIRRKYLRKKFEVGFWMAVVPFAALVVAALALLI